MTDERRGDPDVQGVWRDAACTCCGGTGRCGCVIAVCATCAACAVCCRCAAHRAVTDAERYVLARVRDGEPLSHMHRRALWRVVERGAAVCLP